MAVKGDPRRAFWLMVVGFSLIAGGILACFGVRHAMEQRIEERVAAEADAARAGTAMPAGPSVDLLRREVRVIPYIMLIFTFAGVLLFVMGVAERRGIRAFSPVWYPPPTVGKSDSP